MSKYVLHINAWDRDTIDDFIKHIKAHNRGYTIIHGSGIPAGTFRVKYKDITFKTYNEFMDHLDDTCGGHDGTFGYY